MPQATDKNGYSRPSADARVRAALVDTLYASPVTLGIGGLAGAVTGTAAAMWSSSHWIGLIGAALPVTAALRMAHCMAVRSGSFARGQAAELSYEVGAWLYASLIGALAAASLLTGANLEIVILTLTVATGYAGGICARNAARPFVAVGQLVLSAGPLTVALAVSGQPAFALLAALNVMFIVGMTQVTRYTYRAVADALSTSSSLEQQWLTTLDSLPQMVWVMRPDGQEEYYNRQWEVFAGTPVEAGALRIVDLIHPEDRERVLSAWAHCRRTGQVYEAEYRLQHKSGAHRWILSRGQPERDEDGTISRWYGSCIDIHERVLAQRALRDSEALNRGIIEASPDCISLLDPSGLVLSANRSALRAYGIPDDSTLIGKPWGSRLDADVLVERDAALAMAQAGGVGRITLSLPDHGGERWYESLVAPVSNASGEVGRLVVMSRDITEQKRIEDQVRWTANHDHLTALPNRAFFHQRLKEVLEVSSSTDSGFALLLLDIDNFKHVNDLLGHDAGDSLLTLAAERLRAATRPDDVVARLGGDEFALILKGVDDEESARTVADKIFEQMKAPWEYRGRTSECRVSMGVGIYPDHGSAGAELLKSADLALYSAKRAGRGKMSVFHPAMRTEISSRSTMLARARTALSKDWIEPFYQPKVDLPTGGVAGFEALLRWRDPKAGLQGADTVSAAFEDWSLAAELSDRMVERVLQDVERWLQAGLPFHHVAINAAAAELRRGDFAERLLERITKRRIPTSCIHIEVTEGVFLGRGADHVHDALRLLSSNGINVALDDFGTGYASLSHLKKFPVDTIKIDRSFVRDLQVDPDNGAIVDALVGLGKSLQIDVVAEGIETKAQRDFLAALGCRYGQGFLFGRAVSARDTGALLRGTDPRDLAA